jgi:FtsH-binding integral membrane protein
MAYSQARSFRSIDSAVATLGVSDRVSFLRRTYGHLGIALLAWAGLTAVIFRSTPELSHQFSAWARNSPLHWLLILGAFTGIGMLSDRLAASDSSPGLQYLGLGLTVAAWSFLLQPLLWMVVMKSDYGRLWNPNDLLMQAGLVTAAIFVGLTLTVFVTRKDFSFLRSALTVGSFAAFGVIVASLLLGFSLGILFSAAMVLLMAGYILYQTSQVMAHFRPTQHVAAAMMLFSTVATLFWYVVRLFLASRN